MLGNPEAKDRDPCLLHAACPLCIGTRRHAKKKPKWIRDLFGTPCHYCKKRPSTTIDHKVPRARGGKITKENIVGSCPPCNRLKSDMSYLQFIEIMRKKEEGHEKEDGDGEKNREEPPK